MKFYTNIKKLFRPLVGLWISQIAISSLFFILFINQIFAMFSYVRTENPNELGNTLIGTSLTMFIVYIALSIALFIVSIAIMIITIFIISNLYKISKNIDQENLINKEIMSNANIGFIVLLISLFVGWTIVLPIVGLVFTHKVIKDIEKNKQEQEAEIVQN